MPTTAVWAAVSFGALLIVTSIIWPWLERLRKRPWWRDPSKGFGTGEKDRLPAQTIDDYALSRNIARFGLKFTTFGDLWSQGGLVGYEFFWHEYLIGIDEKVEKAKTVLERWAK